MLCLKSLSIIYGRMNVNSMDPRNNQAGELNNFIYTQCYDQLCAGVSVALGRPLAAVLHRGQYRVIVDEDNVYYYFFAWAEYVPDEEGEDIRITCRISFDGGSYAFSVLDIQREGGEWPALSGIRTDQSLIPRLHADDLREAEVRRFFARYCPEALIRPMPVPIRAIMEQQMGLTIVTDIQLFGEAYGQILFTDDDELVMDAAGEDIMIVQYRRGTVLIDGEKAFQNGSGSMNFTLAHEAYHWFAHRAYVDFYRLVGTRGGGSYNGTSKFSSSDILEIQANAMASRILMPREPFISKYRELAGDDIHATISALSSFFRVSYTAATIRLAQLGLLRYTYPTKTTTVTAADAGSLYFSDSAFRKLIEAESIVYASGHYVYNDPRFVQLVWEDIPKYGAQGGPYRLTEYALSHPEEAFVGFVIDHQRVIDHADNILESRSDAHLRAQIEAIRLKAPSEAMELDAHARRFEKLFAAAEKKSYCDILRQMVIYRYGWMEDFDPDKERNLDPAAAMPETHERYFAEQCDDEDTELRFQDNQVPRVRDASGRIMEEASSPVELFCADTLQPRQYYEKVMKGTVGQPDSATLMSLCVGLCLSPRAAAVLFRSAGRALSWERTDMAFRYILRHLRGRYIEDVNVFLDDLGISPLGARRNEPTPKK